MERVTWYMSNFSIFYGFYVEKIIVYQVIHSFYSLGSMKYFKVVLEFKIIPENLKDNLEACVFSLKDWWPPPTPNKTKKKERHFGEVFQIYI